MCISLSDTIIIYHWHGADLPLTLPLCAMLCAGALLPAEIAATLGLDEVREHAWQILPSNALTGEGIDRGLDWLAEKLMRR